MIAFDTDIHAVAGLLKRYFRELPDPLFTEELYMSFVQGLGKEGINLRHRQRIKLQRIVRAVGCSLAGSEHCQLKPRAPRLLIFLSTLLAS